MPSSNIPVVDNQIILNSSVLIPGTEASVETPHFNAMVDTGAQMTMVSKHVVETVNAQSIDRTQILPVSGDPFVVPTYWLEIYIPIPTAITPGLSVYAAGKELRVAQLPFEPPNYDILLGMDILTEFHITLYRGQFILSN